jgi:integral membrane protein
VAGALTRFRVLAYVVGVFLLLLTLGVVLRYGFGEPTLSRTVSPIHGFLYILYVIAVFDLGRRLAWSIGRMVLVMLAGTVPFLSFYAERVVRRRHVPPPAAGPEPRERSETGVERFLRERSEGA